MLSLDENANIPKKNNNSLDYVRISDKMTISIKSLFIVSIESVTANEVVMKPLASSNFWAVEQNKKDQD